MIKTMSIFRSWEVCHTIKGYKQMLRFTFKLNKIFKIVLGYKNNHALVKLL